MKCEDCKAENVFEDATHDSPRPLCRGCWFDWFTQGWETNDTTSVFSPGDSWSRGDGKPTKEEFARTRKYFVDNGEMP